MRFRLWSFPTHNHFFNNSKPCIYKYSETIPTTSTRRQILQFFLHNSLHPKRVCVDTRFDLLIGLILLDLIDRDWSYYRNLILFDFYFHIICNLIMGLFSFHIGCNLESLLKGHWTHYCRHLVIDEWNLGWKTLLQVLGSDSKQPKYWFLGNWVPMLDVDS